eukprot:3258964-Rhodomonas_salina.1
MGRSALPTMRISAPPGYIVAPNGALARMNSTPSPNETATSGGPSCRLAPRGRNAAAPMPDQQSTHL